jgi:MFS family permease
MADKNKIRTRFGILVVLSGFLYLCPIGSMYSFGNMAPYVISYTRQKSADPYKEIVHLSASAFFYGGVGVTEGLGSLLGGYLAEKIGPRPTAFIGALVITTSTFLTALAVKLSFWAVVVTYGLAMGFAAGFGLVAVMYAATQWLPNHSGLAIGIAMIGIGGSSFTLIPLQTAFINPRNEMPTYQSLANGDTYFTQEHVLDRVPYMFIILGTLYAVIQLISIPFIVEYRDVELSSRSYSSVLVYIWHVLKPRVPKCCPEKPEGDTSLELSDRGKGESPEGSIEPKRSSSSDNSNSSVQESEDKPNVKPLELLKRWDFYLIWISMFTLAESLTYFTSVYKIFGQSAKFSDHTLALVGSFGFVCNCGGRVLWGLFADQVPSKVVLVLIMGGLSALIYTVYITPLAGLALYGLWVAFMYFLFGGAMSVYPTCCAVWYGRVHMSTNYGLLFSSHSFGSVVAIVVSTYGHHALGWMGQFFLTASLCFVGVMFIIIAGERETPKKKDDS